MLEALQYDFIQNAIIAGILVSLAAGIIGSLVVVNKITFLAGGIAHSSYGGIGLAIFLGLPVLFGATVFAVVTAIIIAVITLQNRERIDAIIGIMWAFGMAIGIIFVDLTPGYNVDLMSYLFGSIIAVSSEDIIYLTILDIFIVFCITFFYKQILAVSYDGEFARLRGINVKLFYTLILILSALSVVAAIKVVGLILVIALLTIPTYIAEIFANRLSVMMLFSSILATIFTVLGLVVSYIYDISSGASIIIVGVVILFVIKILGKKMNEHIELGLINSLKVNRVSEPGLYLIANDDEEVLLPNCYVTSKMEIGTNIEVFIYTDSEDRLVATTQIPYAMKNDFASLEVVDIAKFGAFLDMGLPKDLLVPKNKQKSTFQVGNLKVVQIVEDEKTNRLIGTEKFDLDKNPKDLKQNDEVEIIVYIKTPLGFKVIVNNKFEGLIYHNEIFENINVSDKKRAYIKNIREDGKLDISLQKIGAKGGDENPLKVLDILKQNGNELPFTYKSDAQEIKRVFGLSKKAFKAALTRLLEDKKITLENNKITIS